ncbi:LysE family translocator [Enterobacter hormaechei]|uniref:Threonine transporter n=6 Tax=Enterobacteriaceae TaxID=543 RepID=A0A7G1G7W8_KLEPN|nr:MULTISPECIES: LysE family transporter [Enterobacteriaceae]ASB76886.1 threonine transporter [Enterobacter cloacae complex sp.]EAA5947159.1 LysE family translocator [Salmonella enterica subsp. enterica serovar Isangi]EBN2871305.1 LysE family translocator [Salmonella enterica]EBY4184194.1 LysE family translocator [Salmonella enterica subsp. enterica serovar Saintpaul]ECD0710065.1 LysE family translocator [Salmonella enterica subsp. enterica serovar Monschaui]EDU1990282.1 LysE family transloca
MIISSLIAIATVLTMGVISPGPSFIYVARNAVVHSRRHGLVTALGTGVGAAIFSLAAMLGLQKLLLMVPELFMVLKVAGGAYLLWLAVKMFRDATRPLYLALDGDKNDGRTLMMTFRDGLLTQLSNPKTAIIFASIFSALLPENIPALFYVAIPLMSFLIDFGWYAIVSLCLSSERPRRAYLRLKTSVDRASSAVLAALGMRLIYSSFVK